MEKEKDGNKDKGLSASLCLLPKRYYKAPNYPEVVKAALAEMVRQCPEALFDENGMMKKGVIVRHLLLPGHLKNAKDVVQYVYATC